MSIVRTTYGPLQIYRSMLRFVSDFSASCTIPLSYYAWDSRDDESEIKSVDVIGLSGWSFKDEQALLAVNFGVTASTIYDHNLMRESDIMDQLWRVARVGATIPVRDMTTGLEVNQLVVNSFELISGDRQLLRNYRSAAMSALLTAPAR